MSSIVFDCYFDWTLIIKFILIVLIGFSATMNNFYCILMIDVLFKLFNSLNFISFFWKFLVRNFD